ncbi:UDP-galactopyranose mutase [Halovulum sp. GXIMD14793]
MSKLYIRTREVSGGRSDTVEAFFAAQALQLDHAPRNFEEAALSSIGPALYAAFYKGYTTKQWGRPATDLPAFIFRRLPVHMSTDSNVFHHKKQGQPVEGYTKMVENILDHQNITLLLNTPFERDANRAGFDHVFYSGAIDHFFDCRLGRLAYRTLDFETEHRDTQFQDCGTVNYCDLEVPYTRVVEHKHFWPQQQTGRTVISYEFSRECGPEDKPYYPIRLTRDNALYEAYVALAKSEPNVSFVGRLGTYRYLDMDVAIGEAMQAAKGTLGALEQNESIATFFVDTNTPHSRT